jgi:hypothetical protein
MVPKLLTVMVPLKFVALDPVSAIWNASLRRSKARSDY